MGTQKQLKVRRTVAAIVAALIAAIVYIALPDNWQLEQLDPGEQVGRAAGEHSAQIALDALPVKGRAPKTGYERTQFGSGWTTQDGCDTRNTILYRDLTNPRLGDDCMVQSGILDDPYTRTTITFQRGPGTSSDVQIDHVVALSDAWQKGAQQLPYDRRVDFANDPMNLLAVDGPANQQKGDGDAATWLPHASYRCAYVARQIAVKERYSLWVTQAEYDAIQRVLGTCPSQQLPS